MIKQRARAAQVRMVFSSNKRDTGNVQRIDCIAHACLPEKTPPASSTEKIMRHVLAICLLTFAAASVHADNWPAWRGPTGQGYCAEKNVPMKWSDKENVKWKIKLEQMGNSMPI